MVAASWALSVGSDPREWYEDHEQIISLSDTTFDARGTAGYVVDRCFGVQEGSVGWGIVECHTEWNGRSLPHAFRLSAVFHLERGRWKLCHSHRSFAILDEELWGFDLTAVLDSVSEDVRRHKPSMKDVAAPNGTVTILFTDIEPLSSRAMETILDGLAPGLPAGLREQILDHAEGVPFYAVETVRMLVNRGALVPEGSTYRLQHDVESLEIPDSLHARSPEARHAHIKSTRRTRVVART